MTPSNNELLIETNRIQKCLEALQADYTLKQNSWGTCAQLAEIGQLATGVLHELKNPLTVILGFAQRLQRQLDQYPALSESVNSIERETVRCNKIVQDLLNFTHQPRPHKVKENLRDVLDNALALIFPLARVRNVQIQQTLRPQLPEIHIDRHRIQQLIINLCTNALDAMPQGGWLTVEAHPYSEGKEIEITIRDTGIGIPEDILKHIFDPFFTTKEMGKGTGLGLSIVKEIVNEHAGRIQVTSHVGKGTTISVILPIQNDPTNPEPDPIHE